MPAATTLPDAALLRGADRQRETTTSNGRSSTRTPRRRCATPRARPAIRRACCTAIARRCCTRYAVGAARRVQLSARDMRPAGRADVPRQRLGPAVRRAAWSARSSCFPAPWLDGKSLYELFESEGSRSRPACRPSGRGCSTTSKQNDLKFTHHEAAPSIGGSACPPAMMRAFQDDYGVQRAARLGHDRDEPAGHGRRAQGQAPGLRAEDAHAPCRPSRGAPCSAST